MMNETAYPYLAPLSVSMIDFVGEHFNDSLTELARRVLALQQALYALIAPQIQHGPLTSDWIAEQFALLAPEKGKTLTDTTLSRWRASGLLRYEQSHLRNHYDRDSVAALMTLRLLDTQKTKRWHPGKIGKDETWLCWRQDTPSSLITPFPYQASSLSHNLPRHTLLFTNYRLAGTSSDWLPFGSTGAIRWPCTIRTESGQTLWDITLDELSIWDTGEVTQLVKDALKRDTPLAQHMAANMILLRSAAHKFDYLSHLPHLS